LIRFELQIDGATEIDRAFNRIDRFISDFRNVWPAVTDEFYAIEESQFASQGSKGASGRWAPLSKAYAAYKAQAFPGQPILRAENSLYESLTSPEGLDSIYRATQFELTIGSKAPYATAHQRGSGRMPARPPISLTESDKRRMQKAIQQGLVRFTRECGFQVEERAA
jgi:phage gpG-like protein